MDLNVVVTEGGGPGTLPVEVVERKGRGHPDTICDALAEEICIRLCRHYQERFGVILHHNVDKLLLCGGSSLPRFGGGDMVEPIGLVLGGRAANEYRGERIPVDELAIGACCEWLSAELPGVERRHVEITSRIRSGSSDLTRLYARGQAGTPLSNDTSCGAGFAPFSDLERVVLEVEQALNCAETKRTQPAIGTDVKVMGIRRGVRIDLTIGCAFVDRFLASIDEYVRAKEFARDIVLEAARRVTRLEVDAVVNAADDVERGDVFLTVTGTSAEAGDDGEVGRGNRTSGLITPYRPMTLEATAGKNPVSHVGKLYNVAAHRIAANLAASSIGAVDASCVLVSGIGRPIDDPQLVDVQVSFRSPRPYAKLYELVEDVVRRELARFASLREALLERKVRLY
jgi:S-adenosylmethionine synthetase